MNIGVESGHRAWPKPDTSTCTVTIEPLIQRYGENLPFCRLASPLWLARDKLPTRRKSRAHALWRPRMTDNGVNSGIDLLGGGILIVG